MQAATVELETDSAVSEFFFIYFKLTFSCDPRSFYSIISCPLSNLSSEGLSDHSLPITKKILNCNRSPLGEEKSLYRVTFFFVNA